MSSRVPRWLRVLLPAALILVWVAAAGLGGPLFGRIDEVSSNDRTAYLPTTAEATEVQERLDGFTEGDAVPAVVVFVSQDDLTADDLSAIGDRLAEAGELDTVDGDVSPVIPSDDGVAAQAFVPLSGSADLGEATTALRDALTVDLPDGIDVYITGPAGLSSDLGTAFAGIDGLLLGVALAAVLVILVIVYRSLLLPLAVLATSMFALCAALLVVWNLANQGVLLLSGQTQGILFILVIGAATDYALLYVARYREELVHTPARWTATRRALRGSFEPILASGGTVIVGLLCLLLSELRSNSTLGPVAAIGIAFAMLAALTLLPALLLAMGRAAFWPRRPLYDPAAARAGGEAGGLWGRVARLVRARPRVTWITTALVLAVGCVGVTQLQASGVPQSELVLGASEARTGQERLADHFPAGSGSPAYVMAPQENLQDAADVLLDEDGIASVAVTADTPAGTAPVTGDGIEAFGPPGTPAPEPVVSEGEVLLQATLSDAADSAAAEETIRDLRAGYADAVPEAIVGGVSATDLDTNDASIRDRTVIVPVVLVVILLILMLLLRAVLAPVLLILTTVLSFGTAMGVAALVFNDVLGFPGADPAVPLFGFVFLVALGIDYNIFLMTRVREESAAHGTREGVLRGLRLTGGIITSAGLVLAATFTALAVIPVLFLVQLAFIVAFGVLLDTFVVRSLLVPALSYDVGRAIWWPSKLARGRR
ncbi:putative drug exporter of the RND superfamily [Promicromonospora umidemergens]|uniref:Efflux RND transporter permease subunit n=1 Tax=Promicromonospora umidemergens TaxID=629679 RepID=A0ABP8XJ44_9MICO|nr:MMPL family transporter [Promicromonospora umidemergens]MCP2285641.1 putative drug exporter of the RND superfamily [Promicromonospora umidemergens]